MEGWFKILKEENELWREEKQEERGVNIEHIEELATFQAYADDQLVLISGTSARELEAKWGTTYNKGKNEAIFIPKSQKTIRPPSIRLGDQDRPVEIKNTLKYLGVVFDNHLNFVEHVKAIRNKAQGTSK